MSQQQIPDVRVRLSADGVDEVVRAFQKVADAGKKSGQGAAGGFGLMNGALRELKALLPAIGVAAVVTGFTMLVKNALESADAIGKLSQKTGLSTETLSTLSFAAKMTNIEFDGLTGGLEKFDKAMGELDRGSTKVGGAVRELFGNSQALKGLDTDQRFLKVATALGAMEAGYKKTRLAQDFFGRGGAEMIPLMDKLANGGFEQLRQKALALGLVIDTKTAKAAERAAESMKLLELEAKGVMTQFIAGGAEQVGETLEHVAKLAGEDGPDGFKKLGESAGQTFKSMTAEIMVFFETVKFVWSEINLFSFKKNYDDWKTMIDRLTVRIRQAMGIKFVTPDEKVSLARTDGAADRLQQYLARVQKIYEEFAKPGTTMPDGKKNPPPGDIDLAAAKARIEAAKTALDQQLAATKRGQAFLEQQNQHAYEEGLIALEDYYEKRRELTDKEIDEELRILGRKFGQTKLLPTTTDAEATAKKKELAAISAEIGAKEDEREQRREQLDYDQRQAVRVLAEHRLEITRQIADAEGKTYQGAIDAIKKQAEELKKLHLPAELIKQLGDVQTALAQIKDAEQKIGNLQSALGLAKTRLDTKAAGGDLFPYQAVRAYDDALTRAIPKQREFAKNQLAAALALGDPAQVIKAQQALALVEQSALEADKARLAMGQLKASVESGLTSGIENFLTKGIENVHSFRDALSAVGNILVSVLDAMRQVAAQRLATLATNALLDLLPGSKKTSDGATATAKAAVDLGIAGTSVVAGGLAVQQGAADLMKASAALGAAGSNTGSSGGSSGGFGGIFGAITSLFGGGGAAGSSVAFDSSALVFAADGGIVSGPGTGTSDSIAAQLSNGEFVVRAGAVRQPGNLALLAAINQGMQPLNIRRLGGVPRFADGGLVSGSALGSGPSGAGVNRDHLLVDVHPDLVVRQIETGPGSRAVVRAVSANSRAIKRALGIKS